VNRTDRLYALAEELRAVAPRPRTARQLADRFEVSVRTIERDLGALMEAGVPVYATPGPGGGYAVDRTRTLPPVNFSPDEATALALALARSADSPFAGRLRSALRKVVGAMSPDDADRARHLVDRVRLLGNVESERSAAAAVIEDAVMAEQVVEIDYIDRDGAGTTRLVEPVALVASDVAWYFVGFCRLRGGGRSFRLDRVTAARATNERAPHHEYQSLAGGMPETIRRLPLLEA